MGTNFNPMGLKTFADMGFQPRYYINSPQTQTSPVQSLPVQTSQTQFNPAVQATQAVQNNQNVNLEKSPKNDTVTIGGKEYKKKNLIIAGLGITTAVLAAAALAFKGKSAVSALPEEIKLADISAKEIAQNASAMLRRAREFENSAIKSTETVKGLIKESRELTLKAQDVVGNVVEEFRKIKALDPKSPYVVKDQTITRKFIPDASENIDIMEEYIDTGVKQMLFRTSSFNKAGALQSIEELIDGDKRNIYHLTSQGKLTLFESGVEVLQDGKGRLIDHRLLFENGAANIFQKNIQRHADSEKIESILEIAGNAPLTYKEGFERLADGTETYKRIIDYKQGKLYKMKEDVRLENSTLYSIKRKLNVEKGKYQENYVSDYSKKTESRSGIVFFNNNGLFRYKEGVESENDRTKIVKHTIDFIQDKPQKYSKGIQISDEGTTAEFLIEYQDDAPRRFMTGVAKTKDGKITADKTLEFTDNAWKETLPEN